MGILDFLTPDIESVELPFEYTIVRSTRRSRTTSLTIDAAGTVIVNAPPHVSERWIKKWLSEKSDWIQRYKRKRSIILPKKRSFSEGDIYLYQGQQTVLTYRQTQEVLIPRLIHKAGSFTVELPIGYPEPKRKPVAQKLIERFLIKKGTETFQKRVKHYASLLSATYKDIRLKEVSTIWGSCSSEGNLNFNWRLIMAPPEVLDYVVAHEVSHIHHPHHGASFWKSVLSVDLEYREHIRWLKKNSELLSIE